MRTHAISVSSAESEGVTGDGETTHSSSVADRQQTHDHSALERCVCAAGEAGERNEKWGSRAVPRAGVGVCGVLTMTHCLQSSQCLTLEFEISFRKTLFPQMDGSSVKIRTHYFP